MKQNSRRTWRGQLQATSQSSLRQSRLHKLTFISYSPEIPDFLDADECELIIALAENKRLRDNPKITDSRGILYEDPVNTFKLWDLNGDDYIDTEEVSGTVHPLKSKILFVSVYCCLLNPLQSSRRFQEQVFPFHFFCLFVAPIDRQRFVQKHPCQPRVVFE